MITNHQEIPDSIKVLGTVFTVKVEKLPPDLCGDSHVSTRTIRISSELPRDLQYETFWHEVSHIILDHTGIDYMLDEKVQELVAQGFGIALASILELHDAGN